MSETLTMPAAKEKTVPILLHNDVWIQDPDGPEGQSLRLETNIKSYDELGRLVVNPKTREPVVEKIIHNVPLSVAKMLIATGKGERRDPLPGE